MPFFFLFLLFLLFLLFVLGNEDLHLQNVELNYIFNHILASGGKQCNIFIVNDYFILSDLHRLCAVHI